MKYIHTNRLFLEIQHREKSMEPFIRVALTEGSLKR